MKDYIQYHPWKIIEKGLDANNNLVSESLFSLGNGYIGLRGNFEEKYSGPSLQGSYIGGIYYPDKTRVGWWKNGYPEYFAKVLNSCNWIGIKVVVDTVEVDLNTCRIISYRCELNMQKGVLQREVTLDMNDSRVIKITSSRFCSMETKELGLIRYTVEVIQGSMKMKIEPYLNFDVRNSDSNYDEDFWIGENQEKVGPISHVQAKTKKTLFSVCVSMSNSFSLNGADQKGKVSSTVKPKFVSDSVEAEVQNGDIIQVDKTVAVTHSNYHEVNHLKKIGADLLSRQGAQGFEGNLKKQEDWWDRQWKKSDIVIEGDDASQQAIRFNIFQMFQTYTGDNPSLNIGPKGFTGEKYGGSTYWDTEAYCLPFYLGTTDSSVGRNLLIYRYRHLVRAIENAAKLGFDNGAALYPMVTMNGEECHNEWEITFEEIHRNGAIAYAIHNYIRHTHDETYLAEYGLEVLIGISRFWSQRFTFSQSKNAYVMLGVTGPNEYENNVNNNWYTNYIARWCLQYTSQQVDNIKLSNNSRWLYIKEKTYFEMPEMDRWHDIIKKTHFPEDKERGIFLQQDGFLDKEIKAASELNEKDRPIHQHWSWDRILRSCFIKQADVLQGIYFFEEDFNLETMRRNFDFYEPLTVHESSLSPCVHSILASRLSKKEKAYEMYLRTARLDLDDYNNDTEDGCHITSMAGTWLSIVKGFGGMQILEDGIIFRPQIPDQWTSFSFNINVKETRLKLKIDRDGVLISNLGDNEIHITLYNENHLLKNKSEIRSNYKG